MKYWPRPLGAGYPPSMTTRTHGAPTSSDVAPTVRAFAMIPNKRILIVDDSPASLVWQLVLLQEERYETLTTNHLDEGVRIAKLERPDLVLLNISAGFAAGVAASRALRAQPETRNIPIMVVTRLRGIGEALSELESVCDEHITRPFDGVEYLTKVRRCLERSPKSA
jgi:DNA-binding response OmpR family regulator